MAADDLTAQQRLAREIAASYSRITQELQNQLRITNALVEAQKGATANMAAANRITDEQLASLNLGTTAAASSQANLTARTEASTAAIEDQIQQTDSLGRAMLNAGSAAADAYDAGLKAIQDFVPRQLREQLDHIQTSLGGLSGAGGKGGPFEATNAQARAFVRTTQDVRHELLRVEGPFASAFGMMPQRVLGDLGKVMNNFNELFGGPQGMLNSLRLAKVATGEFVLENQALAKAAGLSVSQQQTLMSRQISLTGEASNDMLRNVAVFSKRLAGMTGDSAKMISQNIVGIIDDTEKFGNVSEAQAARISVNLRQLGLGYQELGGMVNQFMNFEQAATSVSALTTVFGVQMDAMEMMQLANEDQEGFLRRIRDQFLSTAKSVDDMSLAEKRLIMQQTGLTNVEAVERLLDPDAQLTSMADLETQTGDVGESVSATMRYLAEDIVDLQQAVDFSSRDILNNIQENMREPLDETAIMAEQAAARIGSALEISIPGSLRAGMQFMGQGLEQIAGMDAATIEAASSAMQGLAENLGNASEAAAEFSGDALDTGLQRAGVAAANTGETIASGLTSAFSSITTDFERIIQSLEDTIKNSALYAQSPSEMGQNITDGIVVPMDQIGPAFRRAFGEGTDAAAAAEQALGEIAVQTGEDGIRMATLSSEQMQSVLTFGASETASILSSFAENQIDDVQKLEIEAAAAVASRIQGEEDFAAAASAGMAGVSEEQANFFGQMTETRTITSRELRQQLSENDSFYSQMARELGRMNITYEEMSDSQRRHYADQFELGSNYETKLKSIMESEQHALGAEETKQADIATNLLQQMRDGGRTFSTMGAEFQNIMEEKYGVTSEMLKASMIESNDISDIVSGGLRERQTAIDAENAARSTEQTEEASRAERTAEASAASATATRSIAASNASLLTETRAVKSSINALLEELKNKNFEPQLAVQVDGSAIVDYVSQNPRSDTHGIIISTKTV